VTRQCTLLIISDESGNSVLLKTLFDSGTQLSILKEDLISPLDYEVLGEVKLQGFSGNISSGKIIIIIIIIIIIRTFVTRAVSANMLNLRRRLSLDEEDGGSEV